MVLPGTFGSVVWADWSPAVALPQLVADQWVAEAAAGNSLGAPTSRPFVDDAGLVFGFALGGLLFADAAPSRIDLSNPSLNRYRLAPDVDRLLDAATDGSVVTTLVNGRAFFASVAADLAAVGPGGFVYLSSWNCEIDLPCLPGGATLRSELTRLGASGTEVRMQLWKASPILGALGPLRFHPAVFVLATMIERSYFKPRLNNQAAIAAVKSMVNGFGFLDDRHLPFGSHHQKIIVLHTGTELIAYVGGLEFTDDRILPVSKGAPLFDVSVRIAGPGAQAVLKTFVDRWNNHPDGAANPLSRQGLPIPLVPTGSIRVQVGHTYGIGFPFPRAIKTGSELTASAISSARSYFYMEDQYYVGDPSLGSAIRGALSRGVTGIVVIAAEDSVGDLPDVGFRRRAFLNPILAAFPGRFLVFEAVGDNGTSTGGHAYVHSKLLIVDDEAIVIGSMNSSRRSWNHDTEVMASLVDMNGPGGLAGPPGLAKALRLDLWTRHLRALALPPVPIDPLPAALAAWSAAALAPGGLAVRPYPPAGSVPVRPPIVHPVWLDLYWNTIADRA